MFKSKIFACTIILFFSEKKLCVAQSIVLKDLCALSNGISESSGLCTINAGKTFWTINDSDGQAQLYEIDSSCNLLRTVKLKNAENKDWEEITADDQGNIFIGDFGNNGNNRMDQRIYIVKKSDLDRTDNPEAQIIHINYSNQLDYPPSDFFKNFDMEAMVWYKNELHLFSKNRTSPFSGYTYHYKFPDVIGSYSLTPIDSFKTGPGPSLLFWITGAAISPDGQKLILLTHDKIWMFYPLNQDSFLRSPVKSVSLGHFSQKEGICFANNAEIYLTDEVNVTINNGGRLFKSSLEKLISNTRDYTKLKTKAFIYVREFIDLEVYPIDLLEIINMEGRIYLRKDSKVDNRLNLSDLAMGVYIIIIKSGKLIQRIPIFKE